MAQKSETVMRVRKKVYEFNQLIQDIYIDNLENYYIPVIQDIILQEYDNELTGRVTDRSSRTNPIYYRDDFQESLLAFDYIKKGRDYTTLITPETNTFNWRYGRLRVIQNIVEGTIGTFVEVDETQYVTMFNKRPIVQPFDGSVPIKERIYLLKLTGQVQNLWQEKFPRQKLVEFPFSNQPPINIFDSADIYVKENIRKWMNEAIREANKEIA